MKVKSTFFFFQQSGSLQYAKFCLFLQIFSILLKRTWIMKNTLCLKTEVRTSCPKAYWGPQFPCLAFFLWGSLASGCNKGKCPVECGEILTICPPSNLPSICPKGFKGHMKESADQLQGSEGQPKGCEGQLEGTKKWWKPEQTKNENILFSVACNQLYTALLVSWLVGQLVGWLVHPLLIVRSTQLMAISLVCQQSRSLQYTTLGLL